MQTMQIAHDAKGGTTMDNQNIEGNDNLNQANPGNRTNLPSPSPGNMVTDEKQQKGPNFSSLIMAFFLLNFALRFILSLFGDSGMLIEYGQFLSLVDNGYVQKVQVDETVLLMTLREDADMAEVGEILYSGGGESGQVPAAGTIFRTVRIDEPNLVERLSYNEVAFYTNAANPILSFISSWIVPVIVMYFLYSLLMRSVVGRMGAGGIMGVGKSKAKEYSIEQNVKVRFIDVAGQDEAKESLMELCDFLHNPDK